MKKVLKSFKGLHVSVSLQVMLDSHHDEIEYRIQVFRQNGRDTDTIENHYYWDKQMAFQAFSYFVQPLLY